MHALNITQRMKKGGGGGVGGPHLLMKKTTNNFSLSLASKQKCNILYVTS